MNKGLLATAVIVFGIGAVFFLWPKNKLPPRPVEQADAGVRAVEERPEMVENGHGIIPPSKIPPPARVHPDAAVVAEKELVVPEIDPQNSPLIGLDVEEPTSAELTELKVPEGMTGVVVKRVDPASPAAEARLEKGDVIVRAQRDKITGENSLRASVADRDHTVLTIYRGGFPLQVVLHKPFRGDE